MCWSHCSLLWLIEGCQSLRLSELSEHTHADVWAGTSGTSRSTVWSWQNGIVASVTQGERCALSLTSGGDPLFAEQEPTADFKQTWGWSGPVGGRAKLS